MLFLKILMIILFCIEFKQKYFYIHFFSCSILPLKHQKAELFRIPLLGLRFKG